MKTLHPKPYNITNDPTKNPHKNICYKMFTLIRVFKCKGLEIFKTKYIKDWNHLKALKPFMNEFSPVHTVT